MMKHHNDNIYRIGVVPEEPEDFAEDDPGEKPIKVKSR
jgi:hypothetical protein